MSSLVHNLGVSSELAFHDVFAIDDPDLLAFVPRPAYALLLVFPVNETYEKFRGVEDAERQDYASAGPDEEVVWFKQTIRNACGLIGLLHGVSNGEARSFVGERPLCSSCFAASHWIANRAAPGVQRLSPHWTSCCIRQSRCFLWTVPSFCVARRLSNRPIRRLRQRGIRRHRKRRSTSTYIMCALSSRRRIISGSSTADGKVRLTGAS